MNTLISWAIFLAIFGGLTWHYAGRPNFLARALPQKPFPVKQPSPSNPNSRKSKAKIKPVDSKQTATRAAPAEQVGHKESNTSRKRKIIVPEASPEKAGSPAPRETQEEDKQVSGVRSEANQNAAFAREMAITRAGTQFTGLEKPSYRSKSRKAQNEGSIHLSNGTDSPSMSTGASSTTGEDADDDLSIGAPVAGGVSDMIEKAAPGPSVLRLTDVGDDSSQSGPKRQSKAFAPAETKKQRQRRSKQEANRALAAEEERDRRKRMEQQIRGARMADGTSAQIRTSNFKAPATNAWAAKSTPLQESNADSAPIAPLPLLDTFESEDQQKKAGSTGAAHDPYSRVNGDSSETKEKVSMSQESHPKKSDEPSNASSSVQSAWTHNLPGEEEQLRLLQNSEDSWTTVSKKDKKKLAPAAETEPAGARRLNSADMTQTNSHKSRKPVASQPASSSQVNSFQQLEDSSLRDSDWAA